MNVFTLAGKMCKGGELKHGQNGKPFFKGSIAVWNSWKKENEFFNFVIFGDRSKYFSEWISDGAPFSITGSLDVSKWEDKSGVQRTGYALKVNEFEIVRMPEPVRDDGRPDNKDFPANPVPEEGEDIPF